MQKTYVITGSTSGIGKAVLNKLAANSDNFIFAGYRNESKLPDVIPDNIKYFYIDMTDRKTIVKAAEFIKLQTNHIDTLINVAGNVVAGPIEKIDTDRLRTQFDVNTFSHIEFTQNLMGILDEAKIINVSSMASFGNFPFVSPYCASKRALDIFFNALELENHKKLKIISVKPGVIATPIWEKSVEANLEYLTNYNDYEKELEFVKNNALKNTKKGLPVSKVADLIIKIDKKKNPKSSYTIGNDAKFSQILSLLPQKFVNKIIKFGMKYRMKL
jgi:short-subunit dehydrogenase